MNSKEVIQNIDQIYDRFKVPPWLKQHMKRVAAVAELICDNWKGPEINKEDIVAYALLHDLANIVKFDLENETTQELARLSGDKKGNDYWKGVKKETIEKYGKEDHEATTKMLQELGASEKLIYFSKKAEFLESIEISKSEDYERKIVVYSDMIIGPFGVLGLKRRIEELKERYAKRKQSFLDDHRTVACFEALFEVEKQLENNISIAIEDLNDENIKRYIESFSWKTF